MARAGVWGADPSVGVSGDYGSNPALLNIPDTAQANVALLVDAPVTYHGDSLSLSLLPSFRLSDTRSYASLNSSYAHFTANGEFDSDLNKLTMGLGVSRDSTLYQNYLVNGQAAVPRDGLTADLTYTRHLTERVDVDVGANTQHVRYGEAVGAASLVNYDYSTVSADTSWQLAERDHFTVSAIGGQYDTVNGTSRSRSLQGQLGYDRSLSESWSLKLTAGYSRQQNRIDEVIPELVFIPGFGFAIVEVPVRIESQSGNPVYSAHLTRSGPRLTLNLDATRQLVPTGYAFLSHQTAVDLQLNYELSPRWSVGLHEYWLRAQDPALQGVTQDRDVNSIAVNGTYQLTEQFTVDLALSHVDLTYSASDLHLVNNQATLTLNYKFNHISLQ